ncbi:SAM-dependent chlorinase/fluorinase [Candidatus Daviesbacteria bacterium]|nr:SAM-dependent chlorinase/fluorinase [Candidatus Daviesbacteria bacterium]
MSNLDREIDLYVIADYGVGDPAFIEVNARIRAESRKNGGILSAVDYLSVPSFSTVSTGFWIRQIGLEDGYCGAVIFSNTAPRGNEDAITWEGEERQRLLYGVLRNGVEVFAVSAGYNWSFIKDELVELRDLGIPNSGSQFRSRDIYGPAVVRFLAGDRTFLGKEIDPKQIPEIPLNHIVVDGYGNLKITTRRDQLPTDLSAHPFLEAIIGKERHRVYNHLAGNPVPTGRIGLLEGSSGGTENRFLELVLRGGSAARAFCNPEISDNEGTVKFCAELQSNSLPDKVYGEWEI